MMFGKEGYEVTTYRVDFKPCLLQRTNNPSCICWHINLCHLFSLLTIMFFYSLLICFESGMSVSLTAGVWGGFAFILVGVVAAGILRRLLYRKPLNKVAFGDCIPSVQT